MKSLTKTLNFFLLFLILAGLLSVIILIDKPVNFTDKNFEKAIREILSQSGKPIYKSQLLSITTLDLSNRQIQNISGIEYFRQLEELNLNGNQLTDVSNLGSLNHLRLLDLGNNYLYNLELAGFRQIFDLKLTQLNLEYNRSINNPALKLSDINLLIEFEELEILQLNGNHITDYSPLISLKNLVSLDLSDNDLEDIFDISHLNQLQSLNLRDNQIIDISPLSELNKLKYLNLHSNEQIRSVIPIKGLRELDTLILRNVHIGDEIWALEELNNLSYLNVRNCSISDVTVLAKLMEKGALQNDPKINKTAYLDIHENPLSNDPEKLSTLVPYWDNIAITYPALLNFATLEPLKFSTNSGFFSENRLLTIESNQENVDIFYTVDGSIPTTESIKYSEPIVLAPSVSDTTGFPKASIIRARAYSIERDKVSSIITKSYFIGESDFLKSGLPILSLVIDPKYLFSSEEGFYRSPNDQERGMKWEYPGHLEFFESDGSIGFEKDVDTRINGVVSRRLDQKSFRIYANTDVEAENTIFYDLFPGNTNQVNGQPINEYKTLILRNSGNEIPRTMFRDIMVQSIYSEITYLDRAAYQPAILYLNGSYWGIYNIRERIDEYYFENHYHAPIDQIEILEYQANVGLVGEPETKNSFLEFLDWLTNQDINDPFVYAQVDNTIDIDNFIDYQILEIYSANVDWPQNNQRFWRINIKNPLLANQPGLDGRWRWILVDMDFAFVNAKNDTLAHAAGDDDSTTLFGILLKNDDFREKFIQRFSDHLNTTFLASRVIDIINTRASTIKPAIPDYVIRWETMLSSIEEWENNVEALRSFAKSRPGIIYDDMAAYFGLQGTVDVQINLNPEHGYIQINSMELLIDTPGVNNPGNWTGTYFVGVPLELHAFSYANFRFLNWEINGENFSSSEVISVTPGENLLIVPVFTGNEN